MTYYTDIDDIRRANIVAGHHWFDPKTMRFFRCRVLPTVYDGRFFISSEQGPHSPDESPRRYTIRMITDNGHIKTIGEFQQFTTRAKARSAINVLLITEKAFGKDASDQVLSRSPTDYRGTPNEAHSQPAPQPLHALPVP